MRSFQIFGCAVVTLFASTLLGQARDELLSPLDLPAIVRPNDITYLALQPSAEPSPADLPREAVEEVNPIPAPSPGREVPASELLPEMMDVGSCPCQDLSNFDASFVMTDGCCWRPLWTVSADAVVLDNSNTPRAQTLLSNAGGAVFDASNLGVGLEIGPRVSLIRHNVLDLGVDLELNYFGITSWGSQTVFAPAGGPYFLAVDGLNPAVAGLTNATFFYGSKIHSGELSARCEMNPWLTLLAGYRTVRYSEQYHVWSSDPNVHSIATGNALHGGQIGAECRLWEFQNSHLCGVRQMTLDATVKAGAFHNWSDQSSSFTTGGAASTATASRGHTAALIEIGMKFIYPLNAYTDLSIGYQAMWLEGVAVAPDQIQTSNVLGAGTTSVDINGSPFLHGGFFGFTSRF